MAPSIAPIQPLAIAPWPCIGIQVRQHHAIDSSTKYRKLKRRKCRKYRKLKCRKHRKLKCRHSPACH
eukprot:1150126-Pelagomonas_calceolata.AAC.1